MKYTIHGKTGRAQLTVRDMTGEDVPIRSRQEKPDFVVKLLPKRANRNTAYSIAGDPVYRGSDLELALMHIQAWTGLERIPLPASLQKYVADPDTQEAAA